MASMQVNTYSTIISSKKHVFEGHTLIDFYIVQAGRLWRTLSFNFKCKLGPKAKLYMYEITFPPAIRIFMAIFELLERRFWTQLKIQIEWKHQHCMYFTEVGKFYVSDSWVPDMALLTYMPFHAPHSIEILWITEFDELKNVFLKPTLEKVSSNAHVAPNRDLSELTKSGNALKWITKRDREPIDRNCAPLLQIVIENEALKHIIGQEKRFLRTATRLYIEKSST